MSEQELGPDQLRALLKSQGFDTSDFDNQVRQKSNSHEDADYIARLEKGLADLGDRLDRIQGGGGGVQGLSYEQQEQLADRALAEKAREALNATRTPWYEPGVTDADES